MNLDFSEDLKHEYFLKFRIKLYRVRYVEIYTRDLYDAQDKYQVIMEVMNGFKQAGINQNTEITGNLYVRKIGMKKGEVWEDYSGDNFFNTQQLDWETK